MFTLKIIDLRSFEDFIILQCSPINTVNVIFILQCFIPSICTLVKIAVSPT